MSTGMAKFAPGMLAVTTPKAIAPGRSPGDHCSKDFLRRMEDMHRETEAMRQQCRNAAYGPAHVEKVSLDEVLRNVGNAQDTSEVARKVVELKPREFFDTDDMPLCLGHLILPGALEGALQGRTGPLSPAPKPETRDLDFTLPGALDVARRPSEPGEGDGEEADGLASTPSEEPPSPGRSVSGLVQQLQVPRTPKGQEGFNKKGSDTCSSVSSDDRLERDSESEDGLRAPIMRFKTRIHFSQRFKPSAKLEHVESARASIQRMPDAGISRALAKEHSAEAKDTVVAWINKNLDMDIATPEQFETGIPIILLVMLDGVFQTRVRWREVDWNLKYRRAVHKNYAVLQSIWNEVRMEKTREFRTESVALRVGDLARCSFGHKLDFMQLMQHWFDRRIHSRGPFSAMARRRAVYNECKQWGHKIEFPAWVKFVEEEGEEEEEVRRRTLHAHNYGAMPEFKRLIWFLGSTEHQTL